MGDSTLRLAVATCCDDGVASLIALVEAPSQGVKRGQIDNIALVCQSINELLDELEHEYCLRLESLYAGISGEFIRCARHSDHVFVATPQNGVSSADVKALSDRMANVQAPEGEIIMERFAQNYMVDGVTEVKNPEGSFGRKLSSIYNFILCQQTPAQRVELALRNCNLSLKGSLSNALVQCEAVATDEERSEGVVIVDVGSEVTDVAICQHNVVRYVASIPLGASAINADIKYMMVPERYIEQLKCDFGNAVSDLTDAKRAVKVPGRTPREDKRILLRNLSTAIEARALDIAEFVRSEVREAGYEGRVPYLILTGGSAKLTNFDELMHRTTGLDVRVGYPINGFDEVSQSKLALPDYSTLAGLLIKGSKLEPCRVVELESNSENSDLIVEEELEEDIVEQTPAEDPTLPLQVSQPPLFKPVTVPVAEPPASPARERVEAAEVKSEEPSAPQESVEDREGQKIGDDNSDSDYEDGYDDDDDEDQADGRKRKGFWNRIAGSINKSFGGEDNEDI